ncbi:cystathionine gamma-synthase [Longibacter salinarum]|uniref:Cystathionine gamma-synthase n=1 Tax=Longibacter salinarum TaxID=1850348 RepID=A0A2A8CZH1_9BACT|nr:PLP-dependent transferase [Longibacter salinarum]PEN14085.1 cystathionine gamma-synthase [Longibacter salinarum]
MPAAESEDDASTTGPRTTAVHAGRADIRARGLHAPPIDLSSTYPISGMDSAANSVTEFAHGARVSDEPVYARLYNPTVANAESAVADLEHASDCVAYGSGMAAMTATLMAARLAIVSENPDAHPHVLAVRPIYGTGDHLLSSPMLGLDVKWVDADDVAQHVGPETALVWIETPANPTLELVDIAAIKEQAGEVPVCVDSTFAPPVLQRPLDHGATCSMHSATKFLGGHGDVVAGVVSTNDAEWADRLRHVRVVTGGLLHPMAAYLLHRSLPSLPGRVLQAQSTATDLAERCEEHTAVQRVHMPGRSEQADLRARQMSGPGTMIAFDVGTREKARNVVESVELMTAAVSLGSVDTLIQHPASMTHGVVDEAAKSDHGITPGLLRLSVGLENADDLWQDLSQALDG